MSIFARVASVLRFTRTGEHALPPERPSMTPGKMVEFLEAVCEDVRGPLVYAYGLSPEEYIQEWLATAQREWLDVLLSVLRCPPPETVGDERWLYSVAVVIGQWIQKDPGYVLGKAGPLLDDASLRLTILDAFGNATLPDSVPWLRPWVDRSGSLSDDELLSLIDTLGDLRSRETRQLLEHLAAALIGRSDRLHDEIRLYLTSVDGT